MNTIVEHIPTDEEIVTHLLSNQYHLNQLDTVYLMRCFAVAYIQIWVFEEMDNGHNLNGDVSFSNGDAFRGDEGDYLVAANLAKLLYPISVQLKNELASRQIQGDIFNQLFTECLNKYAIDNNIQGFVV